MAKPTMPADMPVTYSTSTVQPATQPGTTIKPNDQTIIPDKSTPRYIPSAAHSVSLSSPTSQSVPVGSTILTAVVPVTSSVPTAVPISYNKPAQIPDHARGGVPLSEIVISFFYKGLKTLDHILTVAELHAKAEDEDPDAIYPNARLIGDMKPLAFQVQNATNTVRKTLSRLAQLKTDVWPDDERTMADLHRRIEMALDLMDTVNSKQINARAMDIIELPFGEDTLKVTAKETALNHGLPNFFFHLQTAYSILRAKGVPLGKRDYLTLFLCCP